MNPADRIRAAIQAMLDDLGGGWQCAQHVVAIGLERIDSGGHIETAACCWSPPGQPDWMTTGLLGRAVDLDAEANIDD